MSELLCRAKRCVIPLLLCLFSRHALAAGVGLDCHGNVETSDKQVLSAGVKYLLWYEIAGDVAKVRVAGREFLASAERGKSWTGHWIKLVSPDSYLSFLPGDSGTLRFQLNKTQWFVGNCREQS